MQTACGCTGNLAASGDADVTRAQTSQLLPDKVSALSEARFHKSVKSGRGALRAFDVGRDF
jgi:hypothetical protein